MKSDFPRLDLSAQPFLERNLESLVDCIDSLSQDHNRQHVGCYGDLQTLIDQSNLVVTFHLPHFFTCFIVPLIFLELRQSPCPSEAAPVRVYVTSSPRKRREEGSRWASSPWRHLFKPHLPCPASSFSSRYADLHWLQLACLTSLLTL